MFQLGGNYLMHISGKTRDNPVFAKGAILNLLAQELNCERHGVSFLFGKSKNELRAEVVEIPNARTH